MNRLIQNYCVYEKSFNEALQNLESIVFDEKEITDCKNNSRIYKKLSEKSRIIGFTKIGLLAEILQNNSTDNMLFKFVCNPSTKLKNLVDFEQTPEKITEDIDLLFKNHDYNRNNILHIMLIYKNYNLFFELINYIKLEHLLEKNASGNTVLYYLNDIQACELVMMLHNKFPDCEEIKQLDVIKTKGSCIKNSRFMDYNDDNNSNLQNKKCKLENYKL